MMVQYNLSQLRSNESIQQYDMAALVRTELINIKIVLCRNKYRIAHVGYLAGT